MRSTHTFGLFFCDPLVVVTFFWDHRVPFMKFCSHNCRRCGGNEGFGVSPRIITWFTLSSLFPFRRSVGLEPTTDTSMTTVSAFCVYLRTYFGFWDFTDENILRFHRCSFSPLLGSFKQNGNAWKHMRWNCVAKSNVVTAQRASTWRRSSFLFLWHVICQKIA